MSAATPITTATNDPIYSEETSSMLATTSGMRRSRAWRGIVATTIAAIALGACAATSAAAPALDVELNSDAHEVQRLVVRGDTGQFRIGFEGDTTGDLAYNASAQQVEDALNALPSIAAGGGSVSVLRDSTAAAAFHYYFGYIVTFDRGPLAHSDVPSLTASNGTTPLSGTYHDGVTVTTDRPHGLRRGDERLTYEVDVANTGLDPTSGPVTVELEVPAGEETFIYLAEGTGWSCIKQPPALPQPAKAVCTRSNALAAGASYPQLKVTVFPGADAPQTATATATVFGGGAPAAATDGDTFAFSPALGFEIVDFAAGVFDAAGADYTLAGGHPMEARADFSLTRKRRLAGLHDFYDDYDVVESVKRAIVEAPRGFVGNPLAVEELCPSVDDVARGRCPDESAVGGVNAPGVIVEAPVYAIQTERGVAAQFAFVEYNTTQVYVIDASLRARPDGYAVALAAAPVATGTIKLMNVESTICTYGAKVVLDAGRLAFRGCKTRAEADPGVEPFLTIPTRCSGDVPRAVLLVDSWQNPDVFKTASDDDPMPTDCAAVPFTPSVSVAPTAASADAASGLDAEIAVPDTGLLDPDARSQAHLKKTVVELPDGVSVNPSAATGLEGCSDAQLGLGNDAEPSCPDASVIGSVEATTPVLEETLTGTMVLRTPRSTDPTSGEMLRMALIVRNDERGILVKLAGSAVADPQTGRLTATFDDNPQVPIGTVEVRAKGGPRGVLALPRDCGEIVAKATLTPWSGNADAVSETPAQVGGDCSNDFAPSLDAGMDTQRARANGKLSFRFARPEGQQYLRGLTARLPQGLLASVKDVPLCTNAQADAGSCPDASRIGIVDAKAGSGDPFVLERKGEVFLTEGYKGGEYGLAVKIRPVAGPFRGAMELSPIVVRQAIHVDRTTAQVTAVSDPFPLIHHGIPLRVREVTVLVDRERFMLNPSDCAPKQIGADLLSDEAATHRASNPFQAASCGVLAFKPRLTLALTGKRQVTTGKHPGIKAKVTQQGIGEAAIEKAVVRLPKSLALDPNNAQALCEFADGTKPDLESHCPAGSIVGRARAKTPLLNDDLVGNVYFVKNVRRDPVTGNEIRTLPMIVVALRGEIAVNLKGESSTTKAGKLVNTFNAVPDAPISQFNLNIKGGPNGILAVTRTRKARIDLCARRHVAEADMDAHNGRRHDTDIRMKTPCTKRQVKNAKRADAKARKAKRS